jgi:hypothetical protein
MWSMNPPKEVALLTAAIVAFSEVAAPSETTQAMAPQQPHDHRELLVETPAIGSTASPISSSSAQHLFAVDKVQDEPEIFWLFAIRHPEFRNGQSMKDFGNFTETEMQAELRRLALSDDEITLLIAKARMRWLTTRHQQGKTSEETNA